jgi:acetate kinase
MTVLVVNAGSSSLKYALVRPGGDAHSPAAVLAEGLVERVGTEQARLRHTTDGRRHEAAVDAHDHREAMAAVTQAFAEHGPAADDGLQAVGHRVVHGGESFAEPVVVDDDVLEEIERLAVLAPLHNPVNVAGIRAARERFADVPHVAVFDTGFHAGLPEVARTYAVPRAWREEHQVRRYGFHGTSHAYVSRAAGRWLAEHRGLDPAQARVVVLHLGNGASACAVRGTRSIDTSMGLTPLAGLVMGTRSGDVDPALAGHLDRVAGLDGAQVEEALNRSSGMVGLCGDSDMRDVQRRADGGDAAAATALAVYAYRVRSYLGSYAVALGGIDALAFTAGIGENSPEVRAAVVADLGVLGLHLDPVRNTGVDTDDPVTCVNPDDSPAAVLVVPTDEEGEIARQAIELLRS